MRRSSQSFGALLCPVLLLHDADPYTGAMARARVGLTPDLVARLPLPGMVAPGAIAYSPDASSITFLFSERGDLVRDLWRLDMATGRREKLLTPPGGGVGAAPFSREEALR